MFDDVCTVYNKYIDGTTEKWRRTILIGVYWDNIKGALTRKTGISSMDSVILLVPYNVVVNGTYKKPKAYAALADKTGYWTLQSGDSIVKGAVNYDIVKSSKELMQFDDVLTITTVDDCPFGGDMAHWEVGGK